jgi:hypothetical protein
MSILTVGNGQQYQTLAAATAAASDGDVLQVQAGTYTNDFLEFGTSITLQAVGGQVVMNETVQPPNGKAMIEEWGANVTISGFDISGVSVPDGNGAAVRYEGGNLTLNDDYFHDNQEGLLRAREETNESGRAVSRDRVRRTAWCDAMRCRYLSG